MATYNTTAYLQWAADWRIKHKTADGKKVSSPPKGLWEKVKADAKQFAKWQAMADEVNKTEGRISMKGVKRTASTAPNGWRELQVRLGELNTFIAAEGHAKLKCNDPLVERCKVKGKNGKIDGEASIAKLDEAFLEAYSECFPDDEEEAEEADTQDNE